jgi:hypothetical protein
MIPVRVDQGKNTRSAADFIKRSHRGLHRMLTEITLKTPAIYITIRVSDINENKEYALLSFTIAPQSLPECFVGEVSCHSEEEFRQLIKKYMEN